jgi:plastocyanin
MIPRTPSVKNRSGACRHGGRLALVQAAAACLLAACGTGAGEPALVVMEPGTFYAPGTLTIAAGTTVIWRNQDRMVHTVSAGPEIETGTFLLASSLPADAEPFDSGDLFSGHTWQHTFDVTGRYTYYCRYHADEQMLGTIVVE